MRKPTCKKIEELMVRGLDEGLTEKENSLVQAHLGECACCRQFQEETSDLLNVIASGAAKDPGEEYWRRYFVSLDARLQEKELQPGWGFTWKLVAVATCAVSAFVVMRVALLDPDKLSWINEEVQVALFQDLERLYGPVEDSDTELPPAHSQTRLVYDGTLPRDVLIDWFEVEDERTSSIL